MDDGITRQLRTDGFGTDALVSHGALKLSSGHLEYSSGMPMAVPAPASQVSRKLALANIKEARRTSPSLEVHHASPLSPIRTRDAEALEALFDCDRIQDITLDVHRYLAFLYPAPCWEDEPYEFLHGYV